MEGKRYDGGAGVFSGSGRNSCWGLVDVAVLGERGGLEEVNGLLGVGLRGSAEGGRYDFDFHIYVVDFYGVWLGL